MYGGGFVQGGFVRKWLMSRGSYVWRGFCPRGVLSKGVLSGGGFVRAPYTHTTRTHHTHTRTRARARARARTRTRAHAHAHTHTHTHTHTRSYQVIHQLIGTDTVQILRETARAEQVEPAPLRNCIIRPAARPAPHILTYPGPQPGPHRTGLARSPHRPGKKIQPAARTAPQQIKKSRNPPRAVP